MSDARAASGASARVRLAEVDPAEVRGAWRVMSVVLQALIERGGGRAFIDVREFGRVAHGPYRLEIVDHDQGLEIGLRRLDG